MSCGIARIRLTKQQMIEMQASIHADGDLLVYEVPVSSIVMDDGPILSVADPHLICYGGQSIPAQPQLCAMLSHLLANGASPMDIVIEQVWFDAPITDIAVRKAASSLSTIFKKYHIPYRVSCRGGVVHLKKI